MVSDKNIEPKIGLIDLGYGSETVEFEAFAGTVVYFCSRRMMMMVRKDGKKIVGVALIPSFDISEELDVNMSELDFFKFRCAYLNAISGLKDAGINFPFKISLLYLQKIRVSSDNIEVLGSDS
jgi:hypothetical protein